MVILIFTILFSNAFAMDNMSYSGHVHKKCKHGKGRTLTETELLHLMEMKVYSFNYLNKPKIRRCNTKQFNFIDGSIKDSNPIHSTKEVPHVCENPWRFSCHDTNRIDYTEQEHKSILEYNKVMKAVTKEFENESVFKTEEGAFKRIIKKSKLKEGVNFLAYSPESNRLNFNLDSTLKNIGDFIQKSKNITPVFETLEKNMGLALFYADHPPLKSPGNFVPYDHQKYYLGTLVEDSGSKVEVYHGQNSKQWKKFISSWLGDLKKRVSEGELGKKELTSIVQKFYLQAYDKQNEWVELLSSKIPNYRQRVRDMVVTKEGGKNKLFQSQESLEKFVKGSKSKIFNVMREKLKINNPKLEHLINEVKTTHPFDDVNIKRVGTVFKDAAITQNASYDPDKNRITILGGFNNVAKGLKDLVVGHEVGHALDVIVNPALAADKDEVPPPSQFPNELKKINKIKDCLVENTHIIKGQEEEAFADWLSTEALVNDLKKVLQNNDRVTAQKLVTESVVDCKGPEDYELEIFEQFSRRNESDKIVNPHPRGDLRFNQILFAHPFIQDLFNCNDGQNTKAVTAKYCEAE